MIYWRKLVTKIYFVFSRPQILDRYDYVKIDEKLVEKKFIEYGLDYERVFNDLYDFDFDDAYDNIDKKNKLLKHLFFVFER